MLWFLVCFCSCVRVCVCVCGDVLYRLAAVSHRPTVKPIRNQITHMWLFTWRLKTARFQNDFTEKSHMPQFYFAILKKKKKIWNCFQLEWKNYLNIVSWRGKTNGFCTFKKHFIEKLIFIGRLPGIIQLGHHHRAYDYNSPH